MVSSLGYERRYTNKIKEKLLYHLREINKGMLFELSAQLIALLVSIR